MSRHWTGKPPRFEIAWGGHTWRLDLDARRPGLWLPEQEIGPLLSLEGLAAVGRASHEAFAGTSLVHCECLFDRVEATYSPPNWGDLTVRASWSPAGAAAVDLQVQVLARSVDELKAVEVRVASILPEQGGASRLRRWVEPRDARSAGLSYDGRENDIRGLTTLPPADETSPLAPRVLAGPWEGWTYIEMVHPHDAARRITEASKFNSLGSTTRYGLFGHDLERGVILRARLRGLWTQSATPREDALRLFEQFVNEPPPLGT